MSFYIFIGKKKSGESGEDPTGYIIIHQGKARQIDGVSIG